MNKRIKDIMSKTLDEKFAGTWSTMDMQDLAKFAEKFAELIVKECMDTIAESREARHTAYYYRNRVAEHFGVEE